MSSGERASAVSHERAPRLTGFGLAALSAALWATGGLSAKWLFTPLDAVTSTWPIPPLGIEIDPLMLSACRALLAFGMLLAFTLVARRQALVVRGKDLPFLAFFGVAGLALVHFTYFKTISLTGVATAILLEYLAPVIVLAASVVTVRDRWTWTLPVSVALSVTGCAAVVGAFSSTGLVVSPEGLMWGLLSAVFFAGYTLMGRWAAHKFSAWTLLTYGLGAATIFWVIILGGPESMLRTLSDPRTFAAVATVSLISTVIPFGAFLKALKHIRATEASVTATLEPVLAAVAAWALLSEALGWSQIVGGLMVIGAIVVAQAPGRAAPEIPPST